MTSEVSFFKTLEYLRQVISEQTNPQHALDLLVDALKDIDVRREFFNTVKSAEWIGPLRRAGYFDCAPQAERMQEGGFRYAQWPASQYLSRMAKEAPREVAEIFAGLETDNPFVIGDG